MALTKGWLVTAVMGTVSLSMSISAGAEPGAQPAPTAQTAPARPAAASLPAMSAAQVVDRNVSARGGLAAWQAVHTMSWKGKMGAGAATYAEITPKGKLEQKAVEINLAWQPDLIIMDGRKAFVSGGPDRGDLVQPDIIMASGDMVAIDVEGLKVLLSYRAKNRLPENPWDAPQIVTALRHGLGCNEREYRVLSG
jgi:hypothetical protein